MALTKVSTGMLKADAASVDLNIDDGSLYIDAANNRVGIANQTPSTALEVTGTATATLFSGSGASLTSIPNIALDNSSITINSYNTSLGGSVTLVTDDVLEGGSPTNLYFTTQRARDSFSAGTGVTITNGEVAIGQPVATSDTVTFNNLTISTTATIPYDNTISGLTATTVQSAITELNTLLGGGNIGSQATWNIYEFTTTANQTQFDISTQGSPAPSYVPGYIQVYLNGILLGENDYTAVDGSTINFSPGIANAGQLLSVVVLDSFNTAELLRVTSIDASASTNSIAIDANDDVSLLGSLSFADNEKAIFGAGSGLQIYHDGSTSFISEQGTGNLKVLAQNFIVSNPANTETMLAASPDGAVFLYYDAAVKLATTATGIDVTGTVTADGLAIAASSPNLSVQGNSATDASLTLTSAGITSWALRNESTDASLYFTQDGTNRAKLSSGGDISFYEDTGTDAKLVWKAADEHLGIGTASPARPLVVFGPSNGSIGIDGPATGNQQVAFAQAGTDKAYLTYWDSSDTLALTDGSANGLHFSPSTGNVGIGTSSPNRQLELSTVISGAPTPSGFAGGSLRLSNLTEYESNYGTTGGDFLGSIEFYSGDTSTGTGVRTAIKTSVDAYYNDNSLIFYTAPAATAGILERMRIDSSGRIGIGVTPNSSNDMDDVILQFPSNYAIGGAYSSFGETASGQSTIIGNNIRAEVGANNQVVRHISGNDAGSFLKLTYNQGFTIHTGITSTLGTGVDHTINERVRVDTSGQVGINESSINAYLHVTGKASYTTAATGEVSGLGFVRFQPNSSSEHSLWFHNAGNNLGISGYTDAATTTARDISLQTYGGNVGIGTDSPEKNLSIGSSQAEGIQFNFDTTNNYRNQILNYWNSSVDSRMDFNIARASGATPSTIMSVGYNSNVGIGTTSPQAKFQINEKDTTDNNAVALFYGDKSGRIFQRQLFNGGTNSSETIDILSIDSYQSANTNIFVNVKLMMVSPVDTYAKTIVLSAFKDNGGSSGTGTTTTLASFGTPPTDPTLSWSGDTLQMTTPAIAFLRYSMDVEYIAYDGATVTIPTTYYAGS